MTDRNKELVPYSWSPVREKTTGLCSEGWYSEHSGVCRRAELPGRNNSSAYTIMSPWFCPGFIAKHYSAPFSGGLNKILSSQQRKRIETAKLQQHLNDKKCCSFLRLSPLGIYSLRPLPRPQVGVEEKGDSQLQGIDTHGVVLGAVHVFLSHTTPNHPSVSDTQGYRCW